MNDPGFLDTILDFETYAPHGYCLLWRPELIGLHVVSNLAIALAYYSIPPTILYLVRRHRAELPFRWVFVMFAVFIFLCGTTHVIDIITLWYPIYFLQGIVMALTAAASLATALLMFPLIPTVFEYLRSASLKPQDTPTGS